MRKEIFLAIGIGFVLGLVITYGFWLADNSLNQLPTNTIANQSDNKPSPPPAASPSPSPVQTTQTPPPAKSKLEISITEPADEHLSDKPTITLKGVTSPNTVIAITDELTQKTITSDSSGDFSTEIKLEGGYNIITATAVDKQGNTAAASITVTYTTAKL